MIDECQPSFSCDWNRIYIKSRLMDSGKAMRAQMYSGFPQVNITVMFKKTSLQCSRLRVSPQMISSQ